MCETLTRVAIHIAIPILAFGIRLAGQTRGSSGMVIVLVPLNAIPKDLLDPLIGFLREGTGKLSSLTANHPTAVIFIRSFRLSLLELTGTFAACVVAHQT